MLGHLGLDVLADNGLTGLLVKGHFLGNLEGVAILGDTGLWADVVAVAALQNHFRGSFHVHADGVIKAGVLDCDDGSLQLGVEGHLGEDSAVLAGHNFMHCDFSVLEPLDKGNFGAVADRDVKRVLGHLNVSLRVVNNALGDLVDDGLVKVAVEEGILLGDLDKDILSVEVDNFHLLGGHGAGLAKAKLGDLAALLNCSDIADKDVVVLAHEKDGVGEGHLDGHVKTLGNNDDKHNESDQTVLANLESELVTLQQGVGSLLDEEDDKRAHEDGDGSDESEELDASTNVGELLSKFGLLVTDVVLDANDTAGGVLTNAADESLADTLLDEGVSVKEGSLILVLGEVGVRKSGDFVFIEASALRDGKVGGLENEAVGGNLITGLEVDDITNEKVPDGEGLGLALLTAKDGHILFEVEVLKLDELGVLVVIAP